MPVFRGPRAVTATYVRPSDLLIAITSAVVVHVLLFLSLVVMAARTIVAAAQPEVPPETLYVEVRPEMFERPEAPPAEEAEPKDKQFVRTLASQESPEEAKDTPLIGEFNTKAASDAPIDPLAPRLPSVAGLDEENRKDISTFDSNFNDGEDPAPVPTPSTVRPVPPPKPLASTPGETPPEPQEEQVEQEEKKQGDPVEELRQTENTIEVPSEQGDDPERMEEQLPKEEQAETAPEAANTPGGAEETPPEATPAPPKDPGFQTQVRKRRLRGSIGRNGPVAPEVRNTPLGRYQAQLSRAVEREWQRNCIRYRNHITPGILTIRFLVDDKGRVSGIRFLDVVEAGEIQKGFTMNSLKEAPIPRMPMDVKKDLDGDPLELIYNFYF